MRPDIFKVGVDHVGATKSLKRLARCCRRAGHATVRKRSAKEAAFRAHITLTRARGQIKSLAGGSILKLPPVLEIRWDADLN